MAEDKIIWTYRPGRGLGFKLALGVFLLVAVLMLAVYSVMRLRVEETLLAQLRMKGETAARELSVNMAEALTLGDHLLLTETVDKVMQSDAGIHHIAFVDEMGMSLAHSDERQEGEAYTMPPGVRAEALAPGQVYEYPIQGAACLDFEMPIFREEKRSGPPARIGSVHVVYYLQPLENLLNQALKDLLLLGAAALAVSLLLGWFWGARLARPLREIARVTEKIGAGEQDPQLYVPRRDEIGAIAHQVSEMANSLSQAQAERISQEKSQHQEETAETIQNLLVPKTTPRIPGYSLALRYQAGDKVSSDYLDFVELEKGYWGFAVADVTGKGVSSGLVMAQTRACLRGLAREQLSPSRVLSKLNRQLDPDLREDTYLTVSYVVLDTARRSLTLARAGHLPAVIYRRSESRCEADMPSGMAVGLAEPDKFEALLSEKRIKLNVGDFLLLHTDGVEQACNAEGELFGRERMLAALKDAANASASKILRNLEQKIRTFIGDAIQPDDWTMLVVKLEEE